MGGCKVLGIYLFHGLCTEMKEDMQVKIRARQRVWLEEYLRTWNACEAAHRAGYTDPIQAGMSNLGNPTLKQMIAQRLADRAMTTEEALDRLAEQARGSYAEFITEMGTIDLRAMKAAGKMYLIKQVKPTAHGLAVEFYDAQTALIHMGRYHKLFTDKVEAKEEVVLHVTYAEDIRSEEEDVK
jgi:Terminase small subunit